MSYWIMLQNIKIDIDLQSFPDTEMARVIEIFPCGGLETLSWKINTLVADDLSTQGDWASATMVLIYFIQTCIRYIFI